MEKGLRWSEVVVGWVGEEEEGVGLGSSDEEEEEEEEDILIDGLSLLDLTLFCLST